MTEVGEKLAWPAPQNVVLIDTQGSWFRNELTPLIEEHFPLRENYWSPLNLFMIQGNDSFSEIRVADIIIGEGVDPEDEERILSGDYLLHRDYDWQEISVVLWCLYKKELIILPECDTILFRVWW